MLGTTVMCKFNKLEIRPLRQPPIALVVHPTSIFYIVPSQSM